MMMHSNLFVNLKALDILVFCELDYLWHGTLDQVTDLSSESESRADFGDNRNSARTQSLCCPP